MGIVDARVEFSPDYQRSRQDPSFYTIDNPTWVADIHLDGRMLSVYCVGEMRIQFPYEDYPITNTSQLLESNINTDNDLFDLSDYFLDDDIWINNSWFELVTPDRQHLDEAFFTVDDAVNMAYNLLGDENFLKIHPCTIKEKMKFNQKDVGVYVEGASLFNPTEQNLAILEFAINHGYLLTMEELQLYKDQYKSIDDLSYDWYEDLNWELEVAIQYLNNHCCEPGVAFTFVDTDFVLIGGNGLDNSPREMVE